MVELECIVAFVHSPSLVWPIVRHGREARAWSIAVSWHRSAPAANVQRPETRHGHPRAGLRPCAHRPADADGGDGNGLAQWLSARSIWDWEPGWKAGSEFLSWMSLARCGGAKLRRKRQDWSPDRCSGWRTIEKAARLTDLAWPLGELPTRSQWPSSREGGKLVSLGRSVIASSLPFVLRLASAWGSSTAEDPQAPRWIFPGHETRPFPLWDSIRAI